MKGDLTAFQKAKRLQFFSFSALSAASSEAGERKAFVLR